MTEILSHTATIALVVLILVAVVYEIYTSFEKKKAHWWINEAGRAETSSEVVFNSEKGKKVLEQASKVRVNHPHWAPTSEDLDSLQDHWENEYQNLKDKETSSPVNWISIDDLIEELCEDPEFKNEYEIAKDEILNKLYGRNIKLMEEAEQLKKGLRAKLHADATNAVPVNRGTPDKYTQEASESLTLENLEAKVKEEIKKMEDWNE